MQMPINQRRQGYEVPAKKKNIHAKGIIYIATYKGLRRSNQIKANKDRGNDLS